jgi:hypothetical protein
MSNIAKLNIDCDDTITKINIDIFKTILTNFDMRLLNKSIMIKKNEIYNNNFNYDNKYKNVVYQKKSTTNNNNNRLNIIHHEFTDDAKCTKIFTSCLNKLTNDKKTVILTKIEELLKSINKDSVKLSLFVILWNFIKKNFAVIYIDIIDLFKIYYDIDIINNTWDKYISLNEWYPEKSILDNNMLLSSNVNNDEYCDYIKWKNSVKNITKLWCHLFKNDEELCRLDVLLIKISELLLECINSEKIIDKTHIVNFALEQILIISRIRKNSDIIDIIKNINIGNLNVSSKFMIKDILEL